MFSPSSDGNSDPEMHRASDLSVELWRYSPFNGPEASFVHFGVYKRVTVLLVVQVCDNEPKVVVSPGRAVFLRKDQLLIINVL